MGKASRLRRQRVQRVIIPVDPSKIHNQQLLAHPEGGTHQWTTMVVYGMTDEQAARASIDGAVGTIGNLLTVEGPGCICCEQMYTPGIAALPCPGEPSE